MDAEILKTLLQAGSAGVALVALWLYAHNVRQLLGLLSKLRDENEKLVSACLDLANDRETLNAVLIKTLELLYHDGRETQTRGQDRPAEKGN